jgi:hypothetical protein
MFPEASSKEVLKSMDQFQTWLKLSHCILHNTSEEEAFWDWFTNHHSISAENIAFLKTLIIFP